MDFKVWLENNANIRFTSFSNDGSITVYINGQKYIYSTDAMYHQKWKSQVNYRPFKVLQDIKQLVDSGRAELIYPNKPEIKNKPPLLQKTLF